MDREHVISILDSLASGADPATGMSIPIDVFHSPDVIRALFTAADLLRRPEPAPSLSRSRPGSAGARWSTEEDARLCHEFDDGMSLTEIAARHHRTAGAITSRLVRLGRIDPNTVHTRDRGTPPQAPS